MLLTWAQRLSLGSLVPDGTSTLLPNLHHLSISMCRLTAAAAESLLNTACGRLHHVEVARLFGEDRRDVTFQLQQLAGLPSLSSVSLLGNSCPTLFLNTLATRLTALHLGRPYRDVIPRFSRPDSPPWPATLQHAARCTALQSLTIPCVTIEELGAVAPALWQLRRLHLNGPSGLGVDADAALEHLLALPHLTSLRWDDIAGHTLQRSHASSPCRWRELSFKCIAPHQLARLPLHSLTSPVSWETITVDQHTSVAEVQAAADNVTRRYPAGGAWRPDTDSEPSLVFLSHHDDTFTRGAGEGDTPAALLYALQPLLAAPGLDKLAIHNLAWGAEVAQTLGQVLPPTCVDLRLHAGRLKLPACVQLAVDVPSLEVLRLSLVTTHPHGLLTLLSAVKTLAVAQGRLRALRAVHVSRPQPESRALSAAWRAAEAQVAGLDVGVEVTVELPVPQQP